MSLSTEYDDETRRRREAPVGDISPESKVAGYLDDDKPEGQPDIADAVARVREEGRGKDVFGVLDGLDSAESGPDDSAADVAGPQSTLTDSQTAAAPPKLSAPPLTKAPDAYGDALSRIQAISQRKYTAPSGLTDADIEKARQERHSQAANNEVTRAIQAWMFRKPYEPAPVDAEANDLAQRRMRDEARFEQQRGHELSAAAAVAKALRGEPMSEYQRAELDLRRGEMGAKRDERAQALDARKRTMLALYPEHKADIESLTDLGDAQTLQTALEGRLGRAETQAHQDTAAEAGRQHQEEAQRRSEQWQLAMKKWELEHLPLSAEQRSQLEGIEKSDETIDTFEKGLATVTGAEGKLGANFPKLAGAMGLKGADFKSLREGTAIALARGLEGGMARPGNVEIIQHMLPDASDDETTRAKKLSHLREFTSNNRDSFTRALIQGGQKPLNPIAPRERPVIPGKDPNEWVTVRRKDNGDTIRKRRKDAEALVAAHPDDIEIK